MAKKDDLKESLLKLGATEIEIEGKTVAELEVMIMEKTPIGSEIPSIENAPSADELKRQSDEADAKLKDNIPAPQQSKLYTMDDVKALFAEFNKQQSRDDIADKEEEGPRKHTLRMSRINGKFVIGLKNLNTDQYFPDRVIYSQDIFNEQTKQFIPHVTLILSGDDGKELEEKLTIPLETALKISNKVVCYFERKNVDASERYGQIEVQEMQPDQYGMKGTGNFIQGKSKILKETFIITLPNGSIVEVIPGVTNW